MCACKVTSLNLVLVCNWKGLTFKQHNKLYMRKPRVPYRMHCMSFRGLLVLAHFTLPFKSVSFY